MTFLLNDQETKRFKTHEVMVGSIGVGGNNPVRVQSMTCSDTKDVEATIEQIKRLSDAGCEIARMTVQGKKEALACEKIKSSLLSQGYTIPLVADIHFYPPAAMTVIDFVEKVRINPGNFADRRANFTHKEYTEESYQKELERIEELFTPLVEKCKKLKRALRIGTNHGSLSDRIMSYYGDTPRGMVESAFEYLEVCRKLDYHDVIFSMKSSNPKVMTYAYRLLVQEMMKRGYTYPLHLGVTEAGAGEDGRIKSAMGIGALLLDGLGDTIRVSLTEDPWKEIDPCKKLVDIAKGYESLASISKSEMPSTQSVPLSLEGRARLPLKNHGEKEVLLGLHREGSVWLDGANLNEAEIERSLGLEKQFSRYVKTAESIDALVEPSSAINVGKLRSSKLGLLTKDQFISPLEITSTTPLKNYYLRIDMSETVHLEAIKTHKECLVDVIGIVLTLGEDAWHQVRRFYDFYEPLKCPKPVILEKSYNSPFDQVVLKASCEIGGALVDGQGHGIWLRGDYPLEDLRRLCFGILQASRLRMTKTDFISCPSCGRTLFDLQEVTQEIKACTGHLVGVKIAIMGCIVNGPGEMADADFGYVGSKPGKIDLYVGKDRVEKDIESSEAPGRLIELIKKHGRWLEPKNEKVSCEV